jgi:eukaryotic-like serine/threonine-protein kinase
MKVGDSINGYTILEEFRVVGAGLSEWTFAERGGREYFIKRFLSPTYPDDAAPGGAATKERKRRRCAAFEAHHRGIQAALAPVTAYGGNLIATLDFFRHGAKYYKITEKIDPAGLDAAAIAGLPFPTKLILLKTVAHSLRILHDLGIVHGDLKPTNVLIKKTELGYTTKLIDFDSSYIVGDPPPRDEIVGTMNYYSPELVRYIQDSAAVSELTQASDIFALGLIYAEYLTGALPAFDVAHHEAAVAVLNGVVLRLTAPGLPGPILDLVERMLLIEPAARPSIKEVHAALMGLGSGARTAAAPLRPPGHPASAPSSVLRGKGLWIAGGRSTAPPTGRLKSDDAHGLDPDRRSTGQPTVERESAARPSTPASSEPDRSPSGVTRLVGKLLRTLEKRWSR